MSICPICLSHQSSRFFRLKNSPPLSNILFQTEAQAKATERIDVDFSYCSACHLVFNPEFQEAKITYTEAYDNNQLASKTYLQYVEELADRIIHVCGLNSESSMLEVGCGNGYFLSRLRDKLTATNVIGYDPSYRNQYGMEDHIEKSYYKPMMGRTFDLIVFRHSLEGLINYDEVLASISTALDEHSHLYIEATNLDYIIANRDISLLAHECARYYSSRAIRYFLRKFNMELQHIYPSFDGSILGFIARKTNSSVFPIETPISHNFDDIDKLLMKLDYIVSQYRKVAVWGVGGRAITTLTHMSWDSRRVQFGIDIDTNKQGKYIPVTGQLVISPDQAAAYNPDLIIIANKHYLNEIRNAFSSATFLTLQGELY